MMPSHLSLDSARHEKLQIALKEFCVKKVTLRDKDPWLVKDGALIHKSGGYFGVVGARFGGNQPSESIFLFQPQSAITGLLGKVQDSVTSVLLQARVEPGLVHGAQFAPSVQSTLANYLRLHGGLPTAHIDYFMGFRPDAVPRSESTQLDFGERYLMKVKRSSVIEICGDLPALGNMIWMTAQEIREGTQQSHYLDMDLRSLIALAPWSPTETGFCLEPASAAIRQSLAEAIRPDVVGKVFALLNQNSLFRGFIPLTSLTNWTVSQNGLFEKKSVEGFSVEFFETHTSSREVTTWIQPLVNSRTPGRVALLVRQIRGLVEVLVRIIQERGLPNGAALGPSYVRYPGRPLRKTDLDWDRNHASFCILAHTNESDEGGRFFQDTSAYQILEVDDGYETDDGFWLRISELKLMLAHSQICSIQLRAISSLLLGVEI